MMMRLFVGKKVITKNKTEWKNAMNTIENITRKSSERDTIIHDMT